MKRSETLLTFFWIGAVFALFCMTVKYKEFYGGAEFPLYTYGLLLSALLLIIILFLQGPARLIRLLTKGQLFLIISFMVYIFFSAFVVLLEGSSRQMKDTLYFISWSTVTTLLLYSLITYKAEFSKGVIALSLCMSAIAVVSCALAIIIFFDVFPVVIGGIEFEQSIYLAFRLHGVQGESTALAALLGFAVVLLPHHWQLTRSPWVIIFAFIFVVCGFFTGSRNLLVSLASVFMFRAFICSLPTKVFRTRALWVLGLCFFSLLLLINPVVFSIVEIIFFDRPDLDLSSAYSRPAIWLAVLEYLQLSNMTQVFFGHGAYALRSIYGAGFNTPMEVLYDYGALGWVLISSWVLMSLATATINYRKTRAVCDLAAVDMIVYGLVFCMFMSYIPTAFFNFAPFSVFFGCLLANHRATTKRVEKGCGISLG